MTNSSLESTGQSREGGSRITLLVCALSVVLLVLAAFRPMALPDEGRYAEIGRWMWVTQDWLAPRLNDIPFFHKPPLLYWLEAGVSALALNSVWAFRLVPGVHAVIVLSLLAPFLRRDFGARAAQRVVMVFGTSAAFLLGGQYINHDMMVACWINVAIGSFALFALQRETSPERLGDIQHNLLAWIGFAACALGVLSKGLIGVVLPAVVIFVWLCWCGRLWDFLKSTPWFSGLLLFVALTVPWFLITEARYPGMVAYMFGVHQFARFTGTQFNNAQPAWFYLAALSLLMGVWFLGFWLYHLQSIKDGLRGDWLGDLRKRLSQGGVFARQSTQKSRQELLVGLCVIWVWVIVGFFSIPNSKIIGYILPVVAPACVLSVLGWDRAVKNSRVDAYFYSVMFCLSLALIIFVQVKASAISEKRSSADAAQFLSCQNLEDGQIMIAGEYAYDLPFLANLKKPVWVLQNWAYEREHAADNWRREMFEGADFEPQSTQYLKPIDTLEQERDHPGRWLLLPNDSSLSQRAQTLGYTNEFQGRAWSVWRGAATVFSTHGSASGCPRSQ
jgi:4-amino-4-deoxy-L-arabinose transferase-like glycosyltransferase